MTLCTKARAIRDSINTAVDEERYQRTGDPKFREAARVDKSWIARKIQNHMSRCIECGK
ncbi:hypothetical protein [Streptomyces yunnanensis]|uniref:Uncharacterized protein n=1 Tax=Streptomyces yunnanensis TaxID=156453 RepID=A0A9X8QZK9_9ACTN|nr:hypothetical protein [Streptomyces yunnanensis]SHN24402.1 hypothetical protein SAMN05216268_12697 [Streptomyces yunnanensis]